MCDMHLRKISFIRAIRDASILLGTCIGLAHAKKAADTIIANDSWRSEHGERMPVVIWDADNGVAWAITATRTDGAPVVQVLTETDVRTNGEFLGQPRADCIILVKTAYREWMTLW